MEKMYVTVKLNGAEVTGSLTAEQIQSALLKGADVEGMVDFDQLTENFIKRVSVEDSDIQLHNLRFHIKYGGIHLDSEDASFLEFMEDIRFVYTSPNVTYQSDSLEALFEMTLIDLILDEIKKINNN